MLLCRLLLIRWVWCLHHCILCQRYSGSVHRGDCRGSDRFWFPGNNTHSVLLTAWWGRPGSGGWNAPLTSSSLKPVSRLNSYIQAALTIFCYFHRFYRLLKKEGRFKCLHVTGHHVLSHCFWRIGLRHSFSNHDSVFFVLRQRLMSKACYKDCYTCKPINIFFFVLLWLFAKIVFKATQMNPTSSVSWSIQDLWVLLQSCFCNSKQSMCDLMLEQEKKWIQSKTIKN